MASEKIGRAINLSRAVKQQRIGWASTFVVNIPMSSVGLVLVNSDVIMSVWNNANGVSARGIRLYNGSTDISDFTATRDSTDLSKITLTSSGGNCTWVCLSMYE